MEDLFKDFISKVEKEYQEKFLSNEKYLDFSLKHFFNSYENQILFFSSYIRNSESENLIKNCRNEFNVLFLSYAIDKIHGKDIFQREKINIILENIFVNYESLGMNQIASNFFFNLVRSIKKTNKIKEIKKSFSFYQLITQKCSTNTVKSDFFKFYQFLYLFQNFVSTFIQKKITKKEKIEVMFKIFSNQILQNFITNHLGSIHKENLPLLFQNIENILYSLASIDKEESLKSQCNEYLLDTLYELDNKLLKEEKIDNKNIIITIMGLILSHLKYEKTLLDKIIPSSYLIKEINDNFSEKTKKNCIFSNKFLINLTNILAKSLNPNFNCEYFEELFFILDEYVLHLIEPSFTKIFSIIKGELPNFFEKTLIQFLIKKSLSHK